MNIAYYLGPRIDVKTSARKFGYGIWNGQTLWFQDGTEFLVSPGEIAVLVKECSVPLLWAELEMRSSALSIPFDLIEFAKHPEFPNECRTEEWIIENGKERWGKTDLFRAYMYWRVVQLKVTDGKEINPYEIWNLLRS